MKIFKLVLPIIIVGIVSITALAIDNSSLMFTLNTGAKHYIDIQGLEITFTGEKMNAVSANGSLELNLSDISTMQFSTDAAGVDAISRDAQPVEVYTIAGIEAGSFENLDTAIAALAAGSYVIRYSDGSTLKIAIRK